jgi:hypothetical protein
MDYKFLVKAFTNVLLHFIHTQCSLTWSWCSWRYRHIMFSPGLGFSLPWLILASGQLDLTEGDNAKIDLTPS